MNSSNAEERPKKPLNQVRDVYNLSTILAALVSVTSAGSTPSIQLRSSGLGPIRSLCDSLPSKALLVRAFLSTAL